MTRLIRWPLRLFAGLMLVLLMYALAVIGLGLLPLHRHWTDAPEPGITLWVTTNGVHTALVLPRKTPQADWSALFPPTDTRDPARSNAYDMIELGWGNRRFYLDVPNWSDLRAGTAIRAIAGLDSAALHTQYVPAPAINDDSAIRLTLSPEAYARLVAHVRRSVQLDAQSHAIAISGNHYDATDAFYEATGHYSLFMTCNEWVRDALDAAGVRVPWWSPLDKPLFWQLRRIARTPTAPMKTAAAAPR